MEGSLAANYGMDLRGIWSMSWRRFCVLFGHLFTTGALTRPDEVDTTPSADPVTGAEKFDVITDWNSLVGKPQPDSTKQVSFNDFMSRSGIQRKVV